MLIWGIITASIALVLSEITFLLNVCILSAIFFLKKVQKKPEMSLIYSRFVVDAMYAFANSLNLTYLLIRVISPDIVVKNLSFFISWPTFNLGSIRVFLVFFITFDRVLATYFPIHYHKHRSKIATHAILLFIFFYTLFEQFILLILCDFVLDVPNSCIHLGCTVNKCYHNYWLWFEQVEYFLLKELYISIKFQIGYFSIGTVSAFLCFRLYIWNYCTKVQQQNKRISRATKISLLDTVIIFTFDLLPSFLFAHFPAVNFETVGPLSALCKNFGFVVEAIIICKVLIGKKGVAPLSTSKYTPNAT
ncbi:CRE-SRBC-64 protein [Caenorhabditis remanei]|uniref:CRE-SRBC-64 protein n=1 Tax=Caenorhabditis remanei TaxID=31234 RepID=E3LL19_CAERE|nr:CRE-SRBC-64 protein [Caenorhabditis remanei]